MPIINGHYVSKAKIKKDRDFFKKQGLSENQVVATERYWRRRQRTNTLVVTLTTVVLFAFFLIFGDILLS